MIASVVLPCYNPPGGWEQTIYNNYISFCRRVQTPVELVLVMDGVSAGVTRASLAYLVNNIPSLKVIEYPLNKGKGYAIRQGVAASTGNIIIYTDVDFPYTEDSLVKIYERLNSNEHDVAVGVKDAAYYTRVPFLRGVISRCLRFFIRLLLSMPITDTQCGLKGFNRTVAPLFLQTTINRYLFDLEFIRNCYKGKQYRVQTIPITLKENVHFRKMDYRVLFSESVNFIKLLFKG